MNFELEMREPKNCFPCCLIRLFPFWILLPHQVGFFLCGAKLTNIQGVANRGIAWGAGRRYFAQKDPEKVNFKWHCGVYLENGPFFPRRPGKDGRVIPVVK
jgi:hypothetical protein